MHSTMPAAMPVRTSRKLTPELQALVRHADVVGDFEVAVLLSCEPGAGAGVARVVAEYGGAVVDVLDLLDAVTASVPARELPALAEAGGVARVERLHDHVLA